MNETIAPAQGADRPPDSALAAKLRGFGPLGLLAILIILASGVLGTPGMALLILAWARWSRTPWSEIGFVRPKSWLLVALSGIAIGIALKFVMKALVMPLLGADPVNQAYHYLAGNSAAVPGFVFSIIVGAGFGEELVFRGYLFERLGRLMGKSARAKALIVVLTSLLFGAVHFPVQGLAGAEQATILGLAFGALYARSGSLWFLMIAHAAFDLTALWIIYWDLESTIAHWIFK